MVMWGDMRQHLALITECLVMSLNTKSEMELRVNKYSFDVSLCFISRCVTIDTWY